MVDLRHVIATRSSFRGACWGIVVVLGGVLAAWPTGAHAQINPFRGYNGPTLSKEDLDSGLGAARKLLNDDQAGVGKSEDWVGASSGNKGRLTIERAFQRQGMECRALRSDVRYHDPSVPLRTLNFNVCRTQTGEWKTL